MLFQMNPRVLLEGVFGEFERGEKISNRKGGGGGVWFYGTERPILQDIFIFVTRKRQTS
jgi:hypothetical protein